MSELRKRGLKFKKHVASLPGKPDIVFPAERLAIFCDGDFWHGRNWRSLKKNLSQGTNAKYWTAKIENNIKRDKYNTTTLKKLGWNVIRLWEADILKDSKLIGRKIQKITS